MAHKVLVLGESGTGKSASLRNFKPDEILVINSAGKALPFKNRFETVTPAFSSLPRDIIKAMKATAKKVIVVDDVQYILSFPMMRRIKESGWDKWNDIQGDFFNVIQTCDDLPDDVIVYFLSHIQRTDDGHEKIKTVGKMLDEKITIEGLFTIVLKTSVTDGTYCFLTQNSGMDTVKSPIGMFPTYAIDNDLKYVDDKIRNYYEIGDFKSDDEIAAADQEVAKPDVEKPAADGKQRRSRKSAEPKVADSGAKDPEKAENSSDKTTDEKMEQLQKDAEKAIADATAEEAPKQRRRKERNGKTEEEKPTEAPAEEKKEEGTAGKRRRRKRDPEHPAWLDIPDEVSDDELPFN